MSVSQTAAPPPLLIRASAGTGKTYQLSNRYLELLCAGTEPDEILATTFTRKAAGEILDRVLHRLAEACGNEAKQRELQHALGRPELTQTDCRDLLVRVVRNLHRLRIGTLDSFFMQMAGSYALEFGLPPGWRIGEETDDVRLREEAVNRVLNEGPLQVLLTLFHLLTKGDAGRSIAQLTQDTVQKNYALYLDATPEAWEQIPDARGLKDEELGLVLEGLRTAGAACPKKLAETVEKDIAAALNEDWTAILGRVVAKQVQDGIREPMYSSKPIPGPLVDLYEKLVQHIRSESLFRIRQQTTATRELLAHFDAAYLRLKHETQLLRFDDVTRQISSATNDGASDASRSFRLDGRIQHVLLDEFQDTSPAQWKVLRPFARRALAEGSFFCVGDIKQAIYGWRGGVAEIFGALESELELKSESLAESYRSSSVVIDAVNKIFQGIPQHSNLGRHEAAIKNFCAAFPEHTTARTDLVGFAALHVSPEVQEGEDADDVHYEHVANLIAETVAKAPGRSVGVLCRRNQVVARLIYLLRKKGLQASEEGGNPLTDSAPIEAIVSLLRLIDHPGHTIARFHVAHTPLGKLVGLEAWNFDDAAERVARVLRQRLLDEGYGPVILDWAKKLAPQCNERDRNRLQQLIELAFEHQPQATLRTRDFINLIEATRVPDPTPADIRVMSIHQSKGLEFDIVFVPELATALGGQTPGCVFGREAVTEPANLVCRYVSEKERNFLPPAFLKLFENNVNQAAQDAMCVLYVAVTRAVHALYLVIPPSKPKEKNLPKTYAGLIRAALTNGEVLAGQSVPWTHGAEKWFEKLPPRKKPAAAEAAEELPAKIPLAAPLAWRTRGWQRVAPSSLEGGGRVSLGRIFEPKPERAFGRGTLIHAWFEQIQWLDDGPPAEALLRKLALRLGAEIGAAAEEIDEMLPQFLAGLDQPGIRGVLSRGYYANAKKVGLGAAAAQMTQADRVTVETEFPFARLQQDELLQGSIDRLLLWHQGEEVVAADILDFKTDGLSADEPAAIHERVKFYRPQLQAYRESVQELFQLPAEAVGARLIFTACDHIARV